MYKFPYHQSQHPFGFDTVAIVCGNNTTMLFKSATSKYPVFLANASSMMPLNKSFY